MNSQQIIQKCTPLLHWLPLLILAAFVFGLQFPPTRAETLWLLEENHPVEMITFLLFSAAGILALLHSRKSAPAGIKIFFCLFGLFCIFVGMEEIAWGQQLLGYSTPEAFQEVNHQNETTLHNIGFLHGRSELFRLLCGLTGLAAFFLHRIPRLSAIAVPKLLLPWFAVITAHALVDTADDFITAPESFEYTVQRTSELVEFLIAAAALIYILLKQQDLRTVKPCA